ncbi:FkbM family methyltransferase [bacterium]|nr:FkbM family methyltransferase [bacterium]
MASVKSLFRSVLKPILFKFLGESGYEYFQFLGKVKDIQGRLVEEAEMELFPQFVGAADEVLDIGANYAYHTHRLAQLCPQGTVFAFEPIPFTFRVCQRIVGHYGMKNVQLHPVGVGCQNGSETFRVPLADFGGISGGQSHIAQRNNDLEGKQHHYQFQQSREYVCKIVAIDDFLPDLKRVTFVKMDIEGAELFALQGMRQTLERCKPIVMLEINPFFLRGFAIPEKSMRDFWGDLGYEFFRYDAHRRKLLRYRESSFVEANYLMLTPEHQARHAQITER